MSIGPGSRLGHYEITSLLGEGGMGQVYRARDSRLGRDVAIKVLPAAFTSDADRLARFEREARVLASLNHTNIATIHGIEESDGTRALVMELVPGETLEEHLRKGAMPREECLPIFLQIAEALEYAHECGIVHRDLKPANVKLTPDGKVKVLDFGLAKALDTAAAAASGAPGASPTMSPTITSIGTQAGVIMGTAAYMSPEQARGRPVDRRADIWSFGVMMLEALTGRSTFAEETVSDTLAAVLRAAPDLATLPPGTPRGVRQMIARCLRKDARARLQAIGEARVIIEEAQRGEGEDAPPAAATAAAPSEGVGRSGWIAAAVVAALAAGLTAGWFLGRSPAPTASTPTRFALALPDSLTLSGTEHVQLALSRDGTQQIATVESANASTQILYRRIDELEPRILPETEGATSPFFSPDGKWVGFFRGLEMQKIPIAGGPPVRLADIIQPRGAVWSTDGYIYFSPDSALGLSRVSENGGPIEPATKLDEERSERTHRWPEVLPDGSALIYTSDTQASTEYYDDARIEAVRLATGERKILVEGSSEARYLSSGHLVFARGGSLFAVPFDPQALEVRGSPVQVAQGVATVVGTGAAQFALAGNGAALWAHGGAATNLWMPIWVNSDGTETPTSIEAGIYSEVALSPDGKRVAVVGGQGGVSDLWVSDLERGSVTRLTFGEFVSSPTWSPDGSRLAFGSRLQGQGSGNTWHIAIKPADGSRTAEVLAKGERTYTPGSFTPDGRFLLYDRLNDNRKQRDIWSVSLEGPGEPRPVLEDPFMKFMASVSPDGRFMAYVSNESGHTGVYVRPFPGGDGKWQITAPDGTEPHWGPGGKSIFYRFDGSLYRVTIDTSRGFTAGRPEKILDRVPLGANPRTYSVSPDGRFLVGRQRDMEPAARSLYFDLGFADTVTRLTAPAR